jgi:HD-GYP domain-containing protein (c-di-GMP phosphodiesterase class II)
MHSVIHHAQFALDSRFQFREGFQSFLVCRNHASEMMRILILSAPRRFLASADDAALSTRFVDSLILLGAPTCVSDEESQQARRITSALHDELAAIDPATADHSERAHECTVALLQRLELPSFHRDLLQYAMALHDIGKVLLPTDLLRKTDALTEEEIVVMRQHPVHGYEIIKGIPQLAASALLVRHHHERYDGGGYPDGLAGDQIPFGARLFAVVDAFDAMTSGRPYRRARTESESLAEIADNLGTQFDPELGDLFIDAMVEYDNL